MKPAEPLLTGRGLYGDTSRRGRPALRLRPAGMPPMRSTAQERQTTFMPGT